MYSFTSIIAAVQTFVSNVLTSVWKTEESALLPLNFSDCDRELLLETIYEEDFLLSTPELTFTTCSVESDDSDDSIHPFGFSSSPSVYDFNQSFSDTESESESEYPSLGFCTSPSGSISVLTSEDLDETYAVSLASSLKSSLKQATYYNTLKKTVSFADEDSICTIPNKHDPKYKAENASRDKYFALMLSGKEQEVEDEQEEVQDEDYDAYLERLESQSDEDEDEEYDFFDVNLFPLPPTLTYKSDLYDDANCQQSGSDSDDESDDFFDINQFPLPPTTTKTPVRPKRMEGDSLLGHFISSSPSLSQLCATPLTPAMSSKLQHPGPGYF